MDTTYTKPTYASSDGGGGSRQTAALVLAGLSMVFVVSLFYQPPDGDYVSICLFKTATGLPCPGCGLTHSFCALAKGSLTRAFGYNALGPPIFLLAIGFWLRSMAVLLGRMKPVAAFDRIVRKGPLAKWLLLGLGAYGAARIAYTVAVDPHVLGNAPIARLITWLIARL